MHSFGLNVFLRIKDPFPKHRHAEPVLIVGYTEDEMKGRDGTQVHIDLQAIATSDRDGCSPIGFRCPVVIGRRIGHVQRRRNSWRRICRAIGRRRNRVDGIPWVRCHGHKVIPRR